MSDDIPRQPSMLPGMPDRNLGGAGVSDARLAAFEAMLGDVPWAEEFVKLRAEGWTWKESVVIAWESLPKGERTPPTKGELATMLGVGRLTKYFKSPRVQARVAQMRFAMLYEHSEEVINSLVESAKDSSYKHSPDRRLFFELLGWRKDVIISDNTHRLDDLGKMSDAELAQMEAEIIEQ